MPLAKDATGNTLPGTTFDWALESVNPGDDISGIGSIDQSSGAFQAGSQTGFVKVVAVAGEARAEAVVEVVEGLILEVSPPSALLKQGETVQFQAQLKDSSGNIVTPIPPVIWRVEPDVPGETIAGSIDGNGRFQATVDGFAKVVASAGGARGEATVVVGEVGMRIALVDEHPTEPQEETSGVDLATVSKKFIMVKINGEVVEFVLIGKGPSPLLIINPSRFSLMDFNNQLEIKVLSGGCKDNAGNPFDADRNPDNGLQDTVKFTFNK